MVTKRDYYESLEIERTATVEEIKRAYRQQARKYHPDVNPGDHEAEERFKEVGEAYAILSDDSKRALYDRYGHEAATRGGGAGGFEGAGFGGFGDIFDLFFNGAAGGANGRRGGPQRGADLRYDLEVTLEEAFTGVEKTIRLQRVLTCDTCAGSGAAPGTKTETCTACNGQGQVRHTQNTMLGTFATVVPCARCGGTGRFVPTPCTPCRGQGRARKESEFLVNVRPGVDDGMQFQYAGEGESGAGGGPAGDLYIFFHVKEHPLFEREGTNLFTEMAIPFTTAALSGNVVPPTISGESADLEIPEGTQSGQMFRLRGQGMPDVRGKARGDLHVRVRIEVPTRLTDEERKTLVEFAALRAEQTASGEPKSLFDRVKQAFTHEG